MDLDEINNVLKKIKQNINKINILKVIMKIHYLEIQLQIQV